MPQSEPALRTETAMVGHPGAAPSPGPRRTIGGTSFIDTGTGEAIVFIHGVGLNADAWAPQFSAFSATHRVIALDLLGHGESGMPRPDATLDDYVEQVRALLDALAIPSATIIGHSMGGLVAIGFALAHPARTIRVGVLNSVYERDAGSRDAVEARADAILSSGTPGDLDTPIKRWFAEDAESPLAGRVRAWLASVDPRGYGIAYRIFATGDRAFSGKLGAIRAPALFATGALDPNSTPAMAEAMAAATPGALAVTLPGERHVMNLTAPEAVNRLITDLLARPPSAIDPRELRRAFGGFMTGVTVVTTYASDGTPRGFTANSFTSVSLDPPLLLVCIAKNASSHDIFTTADGFAVNILSEDQRDVSGVFASKRPDKFEAVRWYKSPLGNPLIEDTVAHFDCRRHAVTDAGDHVILIGAIDHFAHSDRAPLGYLRGSYVTPRTERDAVAAAARGHSVIGALLEYDGQLLLLPQPDGSVGLPHQSHSTISLLTDALGRDGLAIELGFIYAVYENPATKVQSIWYRGLAHGPLPTGARLIPFTDLDRAGIADTALRSMLDRYASERMGGRFRIYSGDLERGDYRIVE